MLLLTTVNDTLELLTSSAASIDYYVAWADLTASAFTPGESDGNIASATTTAIVAAPAASTQRQIKYATLRNRSTTTANVLTVKFDKSATERYVTPSVSLNPGEVWEYTDTGGWRVLDANGRVKEVAEERTGYTGRTASLFKTGTAADAVGYWYCTSKDAGFPGAWAVGTPGLAGRATDGTVAADFGCIPYQNAATGAMYLTDITLASSLAHTHVVFDCLWVNSGITVTTTTAQTINSVAFPARDVDGTVNGKGCMIALLVTATVNNAAVNNTATVSYTNSDGTAGRTATLVATIGAQIPATALIGTIVWFRLQAGDQGVQSIQSITLATSLVSGSVSLLVGRWMPVVPTTVANVGACAWGIENPGVRLYDGTCLLHCYLASSATAALVAGSVSMMER